MNCEKLNVFSDVSLFKRSSGQVEFIFQQLDEKNLSKVGFCRSKSQTNFKLNFFWRNFSSKKSSGQVDWNTVLTTLPKVARQKSGNFSVEVGKNPRITVANYIYSAKGFVGIGGSHCANPAERTRLMSEIFLSNSVLNYSNFFHKWKSSKKSAGHVDFSFIIPAGFFLPKVRKLLENNREVFLKLCFKTDTFSQIFPIDL